MFSLIFLSSSKFEGGDCGFVKITAEDFINVWHASRQLSGLFLSLSSSTFVRGLKEFLFPPSTDMKQVLQGNRWPHRLGKTPTSGSQRDGLRKM